MKEESHNPWIDPEIEARIVALVLGEASDFERDELDRLIEERPELAAFKKQIQSAHGLLRDVATGELVAEDDDWKLSAEKRSAVLAVISGEVEEQSARQVVNNSAKERKTVTGNFFWNFTKIAAVLCVVAITGSLAVLELFKSALPEQPALVRQLASSEEDTPDSRDASEHLFGEDSGLGGKPTRMDDAIFIAADEKSFGTAAPAAVAEFDYEKSSKLALSAIRGSLGHYDAAASTERVNGPEPPSQQTAGPSDLVASGLEPSYAAPSTGVVDRRGFSVDSWNGEVAGKVTNGSALPAQGGAEWSDRHDGEPTVQNARSLELSFPKLAERPDKQGAFDPAEPVPPGDLTASSSGPRRDSDLLEIAEETRDATNKRLPALGLVARPTLEGDPDSNDLGMLDEFGPERVLDTPISELGFTGLGIRNKNK